MSFPIFLCLFISFLLSLHVCAKCISHSVCLCLSISPCLFFFPLASIMFPLCLPPFLPLPLFCCSQPISLNDHWFVDSNCNSCLTGTCFCLLSWDIWRDLIHIYPEVSQWTNQRYCCFHHFILAMAVKKCVVFLVSLILFAAVTVSLLRKNLCQLDCFMHKYPIHWNLMHHQVRH